MSNSSLLRKIIAQCTLIFLLLNSISISIFPVDTYAAPTILSTLTVTADGGAPFDATSYDPFGDTNTGTDANGTNGIVKAGSFIDYDVQITINDEGSTNVYFTSTVASGFTWDTLPLGCLTSGVNPASTITNGGKDILCNLGDTPNGGLDPGTLTIALRVLVGAGVQNGSTIVLTGEVMSDQIGSPVPSIPSGSTLVTRYAAPILVEPQFEIGKVSWLHMNDPNRSTLQYKVFLGSDGVTPGRVIPYMIYVRAPKTAAGLTASETITIEDTFTLLDENNNPVSHNAELWTWGSALPCSINFENENSMNSNGYFPYGKVGINPQATALTSVPNSGIINCTQGAPGAPVVMNITDIDMTNITGPTSAAQVGFPPSNTYNYQGVYFLWYWIPLADIDNASMTLTGAYYKNTISGTGSSIWDPTFSGGLSNYGTGYEPQSDNEVYHYSQFGTGNTQLWGSDQINTRYGIADALGARIHSIAFQGSPYINLFTPFGGTTELKSGNRIVMPDTEIGQSLVNKFYHYGTGFTASVCEKIDPTKMEFTGTYPVDPNLPITIYGEPEYEVGLTRNQLSEMFQVVPYSSTSAIYTGAVTIEYATTANTPNQRDATCTDADGPWLSSIAAAGTGNITKMRITYTVPTVTESVWVSYRGFMGKKVKPTYSLGIVPVWISSSYDNKMTWEQFDFGSYPTQSSLNPIDQNYGYVYPYNQYSAGSWFSSADRVTVSSALARISKDTVPSSVSSVQLGKDITFILKPTLSGSTSVSFSGSDYVIRDTMVYPLYYVYGSSSLPLDTGYPLVTATGTILQWTLKNITPSSTLPQITYKANTETTSNTLAVIPNTVVVSYPYDASPESLRTDVYNIAGVQNSQYGISKSTPTPEVPIEDILHYTLKYRNFTILPNIPPQSRYIDIFPYNGDGTMGARVKAPSNFTGGISLLSISGSNLETFEYTSRTPSQINPDPCHISNQPLGSTGAAYCMLGFVGGSVGTDTTKWCTEANFGTLNCPSILAEATAFRMTLPTALNTDGIKTVDLYLNTHGNHPGNLYTNTYGTRRENFNLYTASNQATIHVYGASVGDRIWLDTDGDGVQASGTGEYGIGGIHVTLEQLLSGSVINTLSTTTDINGNYLFQDLPGSDYRITVLNNLGLVETYDLDGTGTTDITEFTLGAMEDKRDVDFGYIATSASVGDRIWFDTNGDGIQDSGENGIGGVTVELTDGASINLSTITDINGYYSFTGLTGGNYTISVIPPGGTSQTYDLTGLGTPNSAGFTLGATEIKTNVDFGYNSPLGSLGDQVWLENGTNSTFDVGDVELENMAITLSGTDIFGNTLHLSTTTSATGYYIFDQLVAGDYFISVADPGYPAYWDFDGIGTPRTSTISLLSGQNRTDIDFSFAPLPLSGSIGDRVWLDVNNDGIQDSAESGLSGTLVNISGIDYLGNMINLSTLTNNSGNYLFTSLLSGSYSITITPSTGLIQTYDLDGTGTTNTSEVSLSAGQNRIDGDFGYYVPFVPIIPVIPPTSGGGPGFSSNIPPSNIPPINTAKPPETHSPLVKKQIPPLTERIQEEGKKLGFILPKSLLKTGTSLIKKGVRTIKNDLIVTDPPSWITSYTDIAKAPQDIQTWRQYLPKSDRNAPVYVVVPSAGIVAPIGEIPEGNIDRKSLIDGKEIRVSPYLRRGVLHYPNSATAGEYGNMVIAGHSSYFKNALGDYKTIFGKLPTTDIGEEIWIYTKDKSNENIYSWYRYKVIASYNTNPYDVDILLPENGKKLITLFTCTPIGGVSGRWIIRGELIE